MPGLRSTTKHHRSCTRSELTWLSRKVVVKLEQHRFQCILTSTGQCLYTNLVCEELNAGSWLWSFSRHKLAHFC